MRAQLKMLGRSVGSDSPEGEDHMCEWSQSTWFLRHCIALRSPAPDLAELSLSAVSRPQSSPVLVQGQGETWVLVASLPLAPVGT